MTTEMFLLLKFIKKITNVFKCVHKTDVILIFFCLMTPTQEIKHFHSYTNHVNIIGLKINEH